MGKKYRLTDETKLFCGCTLHRVEYLQDIPRHGVKAGNKGGWLESESNLSQDGDCVVLNNAIVCCDATVYGDATVFGKATVRGEATVCGKANVYGNAEVSEKAGVSGEAVVYGNATVSGDAVVKTLADYIVFKNFWSSGRYFTWTRSNNMWSVGCFYGTGEELIAKAYEDSERSGREYERVVRYVEAILEDEIKL